MPDAATTFALGLPSNSHMRVTPDGRNDRPPRDLAAIDAMLRAIAPEPRASLGPEIAGRFRQRESRMKPIRTVFSRRMPSWAVPLAAAAVIVLGEAATLGVASRHAVAPDGANAPRSYANLVNGTQGALVWPRRHRDREDWLDFDDTEHDGQHSHASSHHESDRDRSSSVTYTHHERHEETDDDDDDD